MVGEQARKLAYILYPHPHKNLSTLQRIGQSLQTRQDAYLQGAYLQGAHLRDADLRGADLRGADLPNGIYQVVGCGSENRYTTYDSVNDRIICGCWNDNSGNALASFEQRINDIYGEKGKKPNKKYYLEYMLAITFFKAVKEETK